MKIKKVLVTGGCGFIGSNLSMKLSNSGINVVIVDNLSSSRKDYKNFLNENKSIEFIESCLSSDIILDRIRAKEFDAVFHVAAIPRVAYSVEHPYETTDVNITKTVKLLEACCENTKRVVFSSSSSVYGGAEIMPTPNNHKKDPKSPYAWQKSAIEDIIKILCDLRGLDAVSLRYFNVFGPGQFGGSAYSTAISAWCHAIKTGSPLRKDGSGDQSRDMCYIDNVVQANLLAMNHKSPLVGECYNVACGDRTSNNQILKFMEDKFGKLDVNFAPFRPGDVMHTQADISETQKILGYKPEVMFWDGLNKTLDWWQLN
jgi:UDP-glucose 4-epimerase